MLFSLPSYSYLLPPSKKDCVIGALENSKLLISVLLDLYYLLRTLERPYVQWFTPPMGKNNKNCCSNELIFEQLLL
jgi:hypothetical protein